MIEGRGATGRILSAVIRQKMCYAYRRHVNVTIEYRLALPIIKHRLTQ